MTKPEWEAIPDVRISSYMGALNKWIAMNAFFVFVVIPNETGDIYAAVKKKLCIESPIPSQVVTISKVLKKVTLTFYTHFLLSSLSTVIKSGRVHS